MLLASYGSSELRSYVAEALEDQGLAENASRERSFQSTRLGIVLRPAYCRSRIGAMVQSMMMERSFELGYSLQGVIGRVHRGFY